MNYKKNALWVTQTAILTALLIIVQAAGSAIANSLITGSLVNCLLIISVIRCGLKSGLWVAVLSPVTAKLLGIGPLWSLIPLIVLANGIFVFIWHISLGEKGLKDRKRCCFALLAAAFAKFLLLYVGIVKILLPLFLHLPEKQEKIISGLFSIPQLATALAGGLLALTVLPVLIKIKDRED